jgi:hypothetical protein
MRSPCACAVLRASIIDGEEPLWRTQMGMDLTRGAEALPVRLKRLRRLPRRGPAPEGEELTKRASDLGGLAALFLGLVLTVSTLYDVFVRRPEADRVSALSQFNASVNAAAKIRQELIQLQAQSVDPAVRLDTASMATPRILNELSTARALLPGLAADDVRVSQLLILISEAMQIGDLESAGTFLERALKQKRPTRTDMAEALRYQGKYLFMKGDENAARDSFHRSVAAHGTEPLTATARAYAMADLVATSNFFGACKHLDADVESLAQLLAANQVAPEMKAQILGALSRQFLQFSAQRCPPPRSLTPLLSMK